MVEEYFGGLDFGSSGARISIINSSKVLIYTSSDFYKYELKNPQSWIISCEKLLEEIPFDIKKSLSRLSISGTSGTLLACEENGNYLGYAIPYNQICSQNNEELRLIAKDNEFLNNPFNSLSKALKLLKTFGNNILLRHQSDWIAGWILNNWEYGEESNNIKLGWNITSKSWPLNYNSLELLKCLPSIVKSGDILGAINKQFALKLNLNKNILIVAGTTDSNAAFIASEVGKEEGLTVLGTTIVLKKNIKKPINYSGVTMHKINEQWICGGASNAGCGILSKFFSNSEIEELSKQINPFKKTSLNYLPLNCKGERFPVNDPLLEPIINPRPVSDALFLQGLFEGLASIELRGWEKIKELTGSLPKKIITIGGGSRNPQWRSIREKRLKIPIKTSDKTTSFGSALIALYSKE
tara:strand:+ start:3050 stop:4282 length:1233 start_codon:yes stop_codon:yes gene_type:complete